ncbi:MAG: RimK/LysX family protein [Bacteriovoracaceae bacterium]|nr:RimK/LysX family protein [Bacteriovoracaceae bacterium]
MNRTSLIIFGIVLAASFIGAANFKDMADQYYAMKKSEGPSRCIASIEEEKTIIGHSETVYLGLAKTMVFDAKVDSGAETSSIHATNIHAFQKNVVENGEKKELMFVRFITEDDAGHKRQLERMVSRIDQVSSASGTSTRYFFVEKVWINESSYEIEINLADRSALSKKMLVGKNLLNQGYLIDTNQAYVITRALTALEKL